MMDNSIHWHDRASNRRLRINRESDTFIIVQAFPSNSLLFYKRETLFTSVQNGIQSRKSNDEIRGHVKRITRLRIPGILWRRLHAVADR